MSRGKTYYSGLSSNRDLHLEKLHKTPPESICVIVAKVTKQVSGFLLIVLGMI